MLKFRLLFVNNHQHPFRFLVTASPTVGKAPHKQSKAEQSKVVKKRVKAEASIPITRI